MVKAIVTERRGAVAELRGQGLSLRAIAGKLGVSLGTIQRDTKALHALTEEAAKGKGSQDSQVDALGLLERAAAGGNVQAIRDLRKEQYVPPCVDHVTKAEHDAALEEVFSIAETNFGPVSGLAKFVEVKVELTDEISHTAKGIRRTYEVRAAVRRQLSGVVEAEPAPVSEPYSLADLEKLAAMIFSVIQRRVLAIPYTAGFEGVRNALDHHCRETLEAAKVELETTLNDVGIE